MTVPIPEQLTPLQSILPSEPLLLMGSGPVPIPQAVARANGEVINHLGPTMDKIIHNVKRMARYCFQTRAEKVFGVAGPSSAAMEMAVSNLLWPGRKALIFKVGTFSGRFADMAAGVGGEVDVFEPPGTAKPITIEMAREALARDRYDVVTMVQGETSCGIKNVHLPEIVKMAKAQGALVVVDAVCTLTTMPMYMDDWQIDALVTGGQKGLSSIPGVSLIAFSDEAWNTLKQRPGDHPHWCFDARRAWRFWGFQQYHYTAPVPGILAIHEALRLICEETLEKRFDRHQLSSTALQAGIEAMGLELYVPKEYRLNSVVAIKIPEGIDGLALRQYMADTFHVEIAGAFGLPILRIGQMGEQCRSQNLFKVLYALGMSFKHEGLNLKISEGMAAMEENLVRDADHFVD
ncbi:Alanine--glyoxylate aminotransferase family protein [Sulfidibacter corallicola]|uniref:Alanine--glyoxylate aminotransferase family protein n=1 Tax=Sulfidibacter corallicola TaxID=2818388 RepID=A0A8A4TEG4_SULCO|nr:alanine--glyoxylate aminotransferase family protein [Sulfidibacter corallicola]QTD48013.1 alanine--glyoxylate aminotransferase family protein [Sulfidibacter corallicola]